MEFLQLIDTNRPTAADEGSLTCQTSYELRLNSSETSSNARKIFKMQSFLLNWLARLTIQWSLSGGVAIRPRITRQSVSNAFNVTEFILNFICTLSAYVEVNYFVRSSSVCEQNIEQ